MRAGMEMDSHGESHDGKEEESKDAPRTRRSGSDTLPIFPPISAGTGHRRAGTSVIAHLFTDLSADFHVSEQTLLPWGPGVCRDVPADTGRLAARDRKLRMPLQGAEGRLKLESTTELRRGPGDVVRKELDMPRSVVP